MRGEFEIYKIDLHVHTSESSYCGRVSAWQIVKGYAAAGFNAFVVTDHYDEEFFNRFTQMSWHEKVDQYLVGYRTAKTLGKRLDIDVFLGLEFRDTSCANDYLIYGLTEDFLYSAPELYKHNILEASEIFRNAGGFVSQAHPMRYGASTPAAPAALDAVEVYNGSTHWYYDAEGTQKFAQSNGLVELSGTDMHWENEIGSGGVILPKRPKNNAELVELLRSKHTLIKNDVSYIANPWNMKEKQAIQS